VKSPGKSIREMRLDTGLSQRELARRARTSQPAIARYEGGVAAPALDTLQRLAAACGREVSLRLETIPDRHDIELVQTLLGLTPAERLQSLMEFARLHELAGEQEGA
jgi:transcriptional regulator with XRE-family HTH domain